PRSTRQDVRLELVDLRHGPSIDGDDHVARQDARTLGGTVLHAEVLDQHVPHRRQVEVLRIHRVHVVDANAEDRPPNVSVADQVLRHVPGEVDRHGESVPDVQAGLGGDGRVDPDDLAVDVDQGTAGVPGVDRRVRLDEALH